MRPDAVTLAKGLANGLPIGALLVSDDAPTGFEPGDHASTFGGNPVACAAACAVLETLDDELLADVREQSAQLAAGSRRSGRSAGSACCSRSSSTGPPARSSQARSSTAS